jgi:hypothetical protein
MKYDPFGEPHVVVLLKGGLSRFWTSVAADGPTDICVIWGDERGAALFATHMDATMAARLARREGWECEVLRAKDVLSNAPAVAAAERQ